MNNRATLHALYMIHAELSIMDSIVKANGNDKDKRGLIADLDRAVVVLIRVYESEKGIESLL